jgi:hypothetical protein
LKGANGRSKLYKIAKYVFKKSFTIIQIVQKWRWRFKNGGGVMAVIDREWACLLLFALPKPVRAEPLFSRPACGALLLALPKTPRKRGG